MVLMGGLFSVRALFGRAAAAASSGNRLRFATQDAGPRPEVRAPFDGVEAQLLT